MKTLLIFAGSAALVMVVGSLVLFWLGSLGILRRCRRAYETKRNGTNAAIASLQAEQEEVRTSTREMIEATKRGKTCSAKPRPS